MSELIPTRNLDEIRKLATSDRLLVNGGIEVIFAGRDEYVINRDGGIITYKFARVAGHDKSILFYSAPADMILFKNEMPIINISTAMAIPKSNERYNYFVELFRMEDKLVA